MTLRKPAQGPLTGSSRPYDAVMDPQRALQAVAVLTMIGVEACSSAGGQPSSPSTSAVSTATSGPLAFFDCDPIDIRSPDGQPVTLTGTWLADDGATYMLRESRTSCLLFGSGQPKLGNEAGGNTLPRQVVLAARIYSDFTIQGWYSDTTALVRADDNAFRVEVVFLTADDGTTQVRLRRYYDSSAEINASWHNRCFAPQADVPPDTYVSSQWCD